FVTFFDCAQVVRLAAVESFTGFEAGCLFGPFGNPTTGHGFKSPIRDAVSPRVINDLNVVEQDFSDSFQQQLQFIRAAVSVIDRAGRRNQGPGGFVSLVAVSPIWRQLVVRVRIDQFETAATAVAPLPPLSSVLVSDFIDDWV